MPNGMKGWSALGEMAAGGIGTPGVYEKQLGLAYDTQRKGHARDKMLEDAARARSQALIEGGRLTKRDAITPELMARASAGDLAAQSELQAYALGSNSTVNLGQLGKYQRPHYGQNLNAAQSAIEAGDAATYNRYNAAALGGDYQPTQVLGGAYVPDGMTMGSIHAIPTPEVLSRIEKNEALGSAATTRANRAPAPRAERPPTTASAEAAELQQAREAVQAGASPAAVAEMLRARGFFNLAAKIHKTP